MRPPDYQRDNCQLFLADCNELLPTLPARSIQAIVADPPYKLDLGGGNKGIFEKNYRKIKSPQLAELATGFNIQQAVQLWQPLLSFVSCFVFCSNAQIADTMTAGAGLGWSPTLLVWNKYNSVPFCHGTWRQDAEFIVHYRAKGSPMNGGAEIKRKVKRLPINPSRYGGPCEKPVALLTDYLLIGSNEGDTILDPFMGTGASAVAALATGRKFIGIERDETYFNAAVKRLESA